MKSRVPAFAVLLCVGLTIYQVIPVIALVQVTKQIPSSGTVRSQNLTEHGTQVWYHLDPDFQMSRVKDLGAKWIRVEWGPLERLPEWPEYEQYMDRVMVAARNNGIEPLVLFEFKGEASITATDYGLEVERLVRKWGLSFVELMNEPGVFGTWPTSQAYVDRIREGYLGAKRANPNCTVIAPFGMMSEPIECDGGDSTILRLIDLEPLGFFNYIDGLVIHPYTMESDPDTWTGHGFTKYNQLVGVAEVIQYLKDWLTTNGYPNFPLWVTEFGYGTDGTYQDTFPAWLVRQSEIHQEKGIVVSIQYCFWLHESETHYAMTLVNNDATLSFKPMGTAYKEFIAAQ